MLDTKILAKLSEGDMISRDACYHKRCLTEFSNKYRSFLNIKGQPQLEHNNLDNIALAEVVAYLEEKLLH